MIPHFIRTKSVKKLQKKAEEMAVAERSEVTADILKTVARAYTPTRFKAKFLEVFDLPPEETDSPDVPAVDVSQLAYSMEWDEDAREMLNLVPDEYKAKAVLGTEKYASEHNFSRITAQVMEQYRKELGF